MQLCRRGAERLGCTLSWRAARRVTLDSENQHVPYMLTVCGVNGATVLRAIRDDIYKRWPLDTPPPPRNQVESLGSGPETYTFCVDGHLPTDARMFTFKGLAAVGQSTPGVGVGDQGAEDQVDASQAAEPGGQGPSHVMIA